MSPLQDTKRSQREKKTVPLPLEIVFRPDVGGSYDLDECDLDEETGTCRFKFVPGGGATETERTDPWEMRAEFLSAMPDVSWAGMALGWGRFGIGAEDISVPCEKLGSRFYRSDAISALKDEFAQWQSLIGKAITTKMSAWPKLQAKFSPDKVARLCRPIPLNIEWQEGRPMGIVRCSGIFQTLFSTLQIDALMGAQYRFCACRGCTKMFKVKRRDQRYHDEVCKHRQAVRDDRDRRRKAALQRKKQEAERKSR